VIDERNGQTSLRICRKQRSWEPLPSGFLENVVFLAKITPYKATSLLARMEDVKAKTHKSNCVGFSAYLIGPEKRRKTEVKRLP